MVYHGGRNELRDLGDIEDTDGGTVERPKYCYDVQGDGCTDPSRKHVLVPLVSLSKFLPSCTNAQFCVSVFYIVFIPMTTNMRNKLSVVRCIPSLL